MRNKQYRRMEKDIDIKSNWKSANERDLSNILLAQQVNENHQKIDIEEFITEQSSVLLEHETNSSCEIDLQMPTAHMINSFTLICECPKLELFLGSQKEYIQTYFGDIKDDFEGIKVYRFDIQIDRAESKIVLLKLIAGQQKFWIFGMVCFLSFKPSISSAPKINLQNVEHLLSNSTHKLSPNAEKCKQFLETHLSNQSSNLPPDMQTVIAALSSNFSRDVAIENKFVDRGVPSNAIKSKNSSDNHIQNVELREYLDVKFNDLQQQNLELKEYVDAKLKDLQQKNQELKEFIGTKLEDLQNQLLAGLKKPENNIGVGIGGALQLL